MAQDERFKMIISYKDFSTVRIAPKNTLLAYEDLISAFPWIKNIPWDFEEIKLTTKRYTVLINKLN